MMVVLIVVLYGDEFGLWLAGALAGFTLLHELGHAVAARRAGAQAEISLNFLAGYASYVPTRPISRLEHIGISFAGPGIQIVTSVAILLAMGADLSDPSSLQSNPATWAIFWAGPIIGLFNLVPILPLDGGNIVTTALDRLLPGRAQRIMLWISLGGDAGVLCPRPRPTSAIAASSWSSASSSCPAPDARVDEGTDLPVARRPRGVRGRQGGQARRILVDALTTTVPTGRHLR